MFLVKIAPLFLGFYVSLAIFAGLTYGFPISKRSPQWGLSSPLLGTGQNNRNIWASVGGLNLSPTERQSVPLFGTTNTQPHSVQQQGNPQIYQDNGHINQNLGLARPVSTNTVSALPIVNGDNNNRANIDSDSDPLLGVGLGNGNAWVSVAGQNVGLKRDNNKPQQNTLNPMEPSGEPKFIPPMPTKLTQQTGQRPQPAASQTTQSDIAEEPAPIDVRFAETLTTKKPKIEKFAPEMFQVQPVRPANEIV